MKNADVYVPYATIRGPLSFSTTKNSGDTGSRSGQFPPFEPIYSETLTETSRCASIGARGLLR